jgi:osmotically-inducible protein OsmY
MQRLLKAIQSGALMAILYWASSLAIAQTPSDNTKNNKGDGDKTAVTSDKQKMNKSDTALAQSIRKAVIADKSLSTYAHNVKIITQNGMVTLKGPVRSEEEKKAIVSKAADAAGGVNRVTDEMSVAPSSR